MGVTYLLDTHVLLWLLGSPERVPDPVRSPLSHPANTLLVSAASAMEISTKTRIGKLPDVGLLDSWERRIADIQGTGLPITTDHALLAGTMNWDHHDPFDRLLVAQAILEGAILVTVDPAFRGLPAPRLLTW